MSASAQEAPTLRDKGRTLLVVWLSVWAGIFVVAATVLVVTRTDEVGIAAFVALGMIGGAIFGSAGPRKQPSNESDF